jgi:hypothetical protein
MLWLRGSWRRVRLEETLLLSFFLSVVAFCDGGDGSLDIRFKFGIGYRKGSSIKVFDKLDSTHLAVKGQTCAVT